jgi:hypothetical protein
VAKCLFCEEDIKYYSFRCPDGEAVACNPCKSRLSIFELPSVVEKLAEEVDEPSVEDGEKEA